MIAPTVGRVVLFRFNAKEDALAAIIAKVLSDRAAKTEALEAKLGATS